IQVTPTPSAIKKILTKLSSIPEDAEKELKTKQDMQAEIIKLRRDLQAANKGSKLPVKALKDGAPMKALANTNDKLVETIRSQEAEIKEKNQEIRNLQVLNENLVKSFNKLKFAM